MINTPVNCVSSPCECATRLCGIDYTSHQMTIVIVVQVMLPEESLVNTNERNVPALVSESIREAMRSQVNFRFTIGSPPHPFISLAGDLSTPTPAF